MKMLWNMYVQLLHIAILCSIVCGTVNVTSFDTTPDYKSVFGQNSENISGINLLDTSFFKLEFKVCEMLLQKPEFLNLTSDVITGSFLTSILKFIGVPYQFERATLYANAKRFNRKALNAIIDYIAYNRYANSAWIIDGHLGITPQLVKESRMNAYNYSMNTLFNGITDSNFTNRIFLRYAPQVLIICVQIATRTQLLHQLANSEHGTSIIVVGNSWESLVYPKISKWTKNTVTLLSTNEADITLSLNLTQFSNWVALEEKCTVNATMRNKEQVMSYSISKEWDLVSPLQSGLKDISFELFDIFRSSECIVKSQIATWNPTIGLRFRDDARTALLETNLRLRTILSFSHDEMPYTYPNATKTAYLNEIFLEVASRLNASLEIKDMNIEILNNFRGMIINGVKVGPVGYLHSGVVDLFIFKMYYSQEREILMRFLPPLVRVVMKIIIKEPRENALNAMYIHPLRSMVWIVLALLLLITVFLLGIGHKFDKNLVCSSKLQRLSTPDLFAEALFEEPSGIASRTFLVTLMWTSFLSYCYYMSAFTSFQTLANIILPFEDLNGLADNMDYSITYPRNMFYQEIFINTPNERAFIKIRDRIGDPKSTDLPLTMKEAIAKADTGKFALLSDAAAAEHHLRDMEHKFITLKGQYIHKFDYAGTRSNFPFTKIITTSLLRMKEVGVINRYERKHLRSPYKPKLRDASAKPTAQSLESVAPLYLALAIGFTLAGVSLTVELFLFKYVQYLY